MSEQTPDTGHRTILSFHGTKSLLYLFLQRDVLSARGYICLRFPTLELYDFSLNEVERN